MLFNSHVFIFLFLPIAVAGFLAFGLASRALALGWVILASIFFYAWWNPINVLIMAPSIFVNYVLGTHFVFTNVILPLGISFITFQKIAFLVDVAGGRVKSFTLREYLLFVL